MKMLIPLLAALTICSTALTAERQHVPLIPEVARDEVICFALYTVHNGVMKMTAQLYPLQAGESRTVALDLKKKGPVAAGGSIGGDRTGHGGPLPHGELGCRKDGRIPATRSISCMAGISRATTSRLSRSSIYPAEKVFVHQIAATTFNRVAASRRNCSAESSGTNSSRAYRAVAETSLK